MLAVASAILARAGRPDLTVVEAGCGKGGSTAKLSLVVRLAGGRLHAFDSFRGIPPNDEVHQTLWGRRVAFREGAFRSRLAGVRRVLARHGAPEVVTLHKGWFDETMPRFDAPVDVALLDVDLVSATRTCVRHLVPRLRADGVLFSQDGHLRATVDLLRDARFWREDVGVVPPWTHGLGREKLVVVAPASGGSAAHAASR
jgi:O-methyltransferase